MSKIISIIQKISHGVTWRVLHFYHAVFKNYTNNFWAILYAIKTQNAYKKYTKGGQHVLPQKLIVSLTSFPPRFGTLDLTLKCLFLQDVSPDKIILWVAEDDKAQLPPSVTALISDDRFEIRTCADTASYKKIIPALAQFPSAFIVTADDDVYYAPTWLKGLIDAWDGSNQTIVAHRVHKIMMQTDGNPAPYKNWMFDIQTHTNTHYNFATGVGGVLYPPYSLDSRVQDEGKFMALAKGADDIWLFWMGRLQGSKTIKAPSNYNFVTWVGSQKTALYHENVLYNKNDDRISSMMKEYGWIEF